MSEYGWCPAITCMTVIAGVATGDMCRGLADGSDTVMAGDTGSNYLRVIDGQRRCKHIGRVAVLADIRCLNVCRIFAGCVRTVMTADAVTGDVDVIEICR